MHVNLIANLTKFEKEYSQANLDVLGDVSKEWTEGIFSLFLTIALNWNAFLYCIFFSSYCWSNCLLTYSLSFIVILNSKRISCIWFLPLLLDLQPILPDCFILIAYIIQLKSSDTTLGVRWLWPGERQVKDLENDTASYAKKATFLGGKNMNKQYHSVWNIGRHCREKKCWEFFLLRHMQLLQNFWISFVSHIDEIIKYLSVWI